MISKHLVEADLLLFTLGDDASLVDLDLILPAPGSKMQETPSTNAALSISMMTKVQTQTAPMLKRPLMAADNLLL